MAREIEINQERLNQAINYGVKKLVKDNPRFRGFENYIQEHLDNKILNASMNEILKTREGQENFYSILAEYVSQGGVLDEAGKRIILREGKKRGFFRRKSGDLEKIADTAAELSSLLSSEEYVKTIPEMAKDIYALNQARFLSTTIDIMKERGLLNDKKYSILKKAYREGMEKGLAGVYQRLDAYANAYTTAQKAAASFFLIVGFGFFFSQFPPITGAAIRASESINLSYWIGAICVLIGSYFGFRLIKKK